MSSASAINEPALSAKTTKPREVALTMADELYADVLQGLADGTPMSLEECVARIKAIPPNPENIRRGEPGLAEVLLHPGEDQMEFDEAAWNEEWAKVEADLKRLSD